MKNCNTEPAQAVKNLAGFVADREISEEFDSAIFLNSKRVMKDVEHLPCWEITDKILAAFYEVYNTLGSGFLESVYRAALIIVMTRLGLRVEARAVLPVHFESRIIAEFRPDLVINEKVIVEIKVARAIDPSHGAQLLNYLRASDMEVGLLLNFGARPQFKREYYDNARKARREPPEEVVD